jgi:hypothetical protein
MQALAIRWSVSGRRIWRLPASNRRLSLADILNIPVFGRRRPETGFDLHCVTDAAVWRAQKMIVRQTNCAPNDLCKATTFAAVGESWPRAQLALGGLDEIDGVKHPCGI